MKLVAWGLLVIVCMSFSVLAADEPGILNQLFGSSSSTDTITIGSGKVVSSTGKAYAPSSGSSVVSEPPEPPMEEDMGDTMEGDMDLPPELLEEEVGALFDVDEVEEELLPSYDEDSPESLSLSEEEVVSIIMQELASQDNALSEEDIRTIIREEIAQQEQFASSTKGTPFMIIALLMVGGIMVGYVAKSMKKPSLPKIQHISSVSPQLISYIKQNRHYGKVALRNTLKRAGWSQKDIQTAFEELKL